MTDQERYTFTYECGDTGITMTVKQGLNVHEMCEQFENFLLATGYRLREYESVGVVDEFKDVPESKTDNCTAGMFDFDFGNHFRFGAAHTSWMDDLGSGAVLGDK